MSFHHGLKCLNFLMKYCRYFSYQSILTWYSTPIIIDFSSIFFEISSKYWHLLVFLLIFRIFSDFFSGQPCQPFNYIDIAQSRCYSFNYIAIAQSRCYPSLLLLVASHRLSNFASLVYVDVGIRIQAKNLGFKPNYH